MDGEFRIRAAEKQDGPDISALAFRSKAYWGYDEGFMNACRAELTYSAEQIECQDFDFYICERNDRLVAFYGLSYSARPNAELEALFVEPAYIGRGVGKQLFVHAVAQCRGRTTEKMIIQADKFAAEFYTYMGAQLCGTRESGSIGGRQLPMFEYRISNRSEIDEVIECQK